jgi:CHAD domain-containing protein
MVPAFAGRFAPEQADRLLGRLAVEIARTIRSNGAGEVHDLRVAIRRFTRLLAVFKPCFPRKEGGEIRRSLKKIMLRAGAVRDRDVALRLLAKRDANEAAELVRQFRAERKRAARALALSLKRWVRRGLSATWRSALDGGGDGISAEPAPTAAARLLPRMAKNYFRAGKDAAREKASAEDLHRLRIAAKNLRYTLDIFAPAYGDSIAGLVADLKSTQTILGAINDCATVRRMVAERDSEAPILAALKRRQRRKTSEFRRLWDEAIAGGAPARWMESLRHPRVEAVAKKPPARVLRAAAAGRASA